MDDKLVQANPNKDYNKVDDGGEQQAPDKAVETEKNNKEIVHGHKRRTGYRLCSNQTRNYAHRHHNSVLAIVMTQMSAKAGVKRFGSKAVTAIIEEYKQL